MSSLYTIKGIIVLDNDGERILAKYYDDAYPTVKEQRAFEKNLFSKTSRANAEIVMFEGITAVYKSNIDLFFYVFGSASENELLLASVLNSFYDAISLVARETVEKSTLFGSLSNVLLILDEIVDGGVILETDPTVLAKINEASGSSGKNGDVPLAEQNMSQVFNTASSLLRRSLLT